MQKLFTNHGKIVIASLFFGISFPAMYAQQKLSVGTVSASKPGVPVIYQQQVTSDKTPITGVVPVHRASDIYRQKFEGNKTALTSQPFAPEMPQRQAGQQKFTQPALSIESKMVQTLNGSVSSSCNDKPIGANDLYVTSANKVFTVAAPGFLVNDIDLDGEALAATLIVDNVDHGTLSAFPDGSFTYIPASGFTDIDQFQYKMRDASSNQSDAITVTIEVREASNRIPIGSSDAFGALTGTVLTIAAPGFLANDIDQDGDALTAILIVDNVDHGSLSAFPDGSFTYTPTAGFTGTDQFQYMMRDANFNQSEAITVSIQVYEGNRNPVGIDDLFGVVTNTIRSVPAPGFLMNDIDPDGDALTAILIVDNVDHGTLSAFPDGSFTYTPTPGFTGTDQFQYQMRDAKFNQSDAITVTLQVLGSGVQPVGFADIYQATDGNILSIAAPGFLMNDIDQNGEPLTATLIADDVDHGSLLAFPDGSFTYTPTPGFIGTDQFQYKMRDASSNQSEAITVTITVVGPYNRIPLGSDDHYGALANTTLSIASPGFLMNDIDQDGDVLTATLILDNVDHGTLSAFPDGSFAYTPTAGFTGTDQFQYRMRDSKFNNSEPITVTIEVYEGNRSPSGTNDIYTVVKNTSLNIAAAGFLTNDYDADGDALTATLIADNVDHGTLSAFPDGSFTYTPAAGYTGTDQFQYKMRDSKFNQSEPVTVTLEVVGPNLPPVASADNITAECAGPSGTEVTLNATNSTDPENGALTFTWSENNNIIAGPTTSPTINATFTIGIHQVTLHISDECGLADEKTITVSITDMTAPVVQAVIVSTGVPNMYTLSCNSSDLCSGIASSSSLILAPQLTNPVVSLKNKMKYSLEINTEKNTVSVEAPNAAAFWAMVLSKGGVNVSSGQVIETKYDKNKFKYSFDATGNLLSVYGPVITLRCTATDVNGNRGTGETTLPLDAGTWITKGSPADEGDNAVMQHRNYPNPFSEKTMIQFELPQPAFVQITILDVMGRVVEEVGNKHMEAGEQQVPWNAQQQKAGVYFYRIQYNGKQFTNRMVLVRQ